MVEALRSLLRRLPLLSPSKPRRACRQPIAAADLAAVALNRGVRWPATRERNRPEVNQPCCRWVETNLSYHALLAAVQAGDSARAAAGCSHLPTSFFFSGWRPPLLLVCAENFSKAVLRLSRGSWPGLLCVADLLGRFAQQPFQVQPPP